MTQKEPERTAEPPEMPPAGPTSKPQIVEVMVAPWQRISVMYRAVYAKRVGETGSIWYWRPMSVFRMDPFHAEDGDADTSTEHAASDAVAQSS